MKLGTYELQDQFEGTLVSVKKERPSEDNRIVDMQEKENFEVVHTAIQTGYFRREAIRKSRYHPLLVPLGTVATTHYRRRCKKLQKL
ncbi:hypothetical protein PC128_g22040 [Phytophthora cactorum]|nr:hypothetical protein PC128_g22040 [Phytophthora cactorum]KAG4042671.1 hypothetical protein PC123_g21845 [Phytophthora cactorum]